MLIREIRGRVSLAVMLTSLSLDKETVKPRQLLGVFDATMIVMGGIVGPAFLSIPMSLLFAYILHF